MDKRIVFILTSLLFVQSCASSQPQPVVLTTSNGLAASLATPRNMNTLETTLITSTPMAGATNPQKPIRTPRPPKTATITLTPNIFENEIPEPTVVYHQVVTPTAPLNPKSYLSILDWIKFSFAHQDLSVIEELALDEVNFGLSEAEYDAHLTKDELLRSLTAHIAPGTQCLAYTFREGEIDRLEVFMANWDPKWEYEGRRTNGLIFYFSDQLTPDSGLRLNAVAVSQALDQYYVTEIFDQLCFE